MSLHSFCIPSCAWVWDGMSRSEVCDVVDETDIASSELQLWESCQAGDGMKCIRRCSKLPNGSIHNIIVSWCSISILPTHCSPSQGCQELPIFVRFLTYFPAFLTFFSSSFSQCTFCFVHCNMTWKKAMKVFWRTMCLTLMSRAEHVSWAGVKPCLFHTSFHARLINGFDDLEKYQHSD